MSEPIAPYTEEEKKFVADALATARMGELGEILEFKGSQNGQEVAFTAKCKTTDGRVLSVRGIYDGSWDSFDCEPFES